MAKVAALLACCCLVPCDSVAGAWTQEPGHGQVILSGSLFRTATSFDASGKPQLFSDGGRFRQFYLNPYLEYGLTRRLTLVANLPAPFLCFANRYGAQSSAGLGDVEVALKRRFNAIESAWAVSGQFTVMFPAYSPSRNPAPGNHQEDLEARFLLGRGATLAGRHFFWDTEVAYRYRTGAPADQVRADATTGLDLTRRLTLMGQFFSIKGLHNGQPLAANSNPNAQSDFDLYKYQVSLVVKAGRTVRIQGGWSNAFAGRNTGRGQSAILALWKTF